MKKKEKTCTQIFHFTRSEFVCTRGSEFARKNVHELIDLMCEGRFGFLYKSLEAGQIARNGVKIVCNAIL